MAYGLDTSWVAAPPDVQGAGEYEYGRTIGVSGDHAMVGGPDWGADQTGFGRGSGYTRISTAGGLAPAADAHTTSMLDDWRDLFDFHNSPTPWIVIALLVAIGFLQIRVTGRAGRARAGLHVG